MPAVAPTRSIASGTATLTVAPQPTVVLTVWPVAPIGVTVTPNVALPVTPLAQTLWIFRLPAAAASTASLMVAVEASADRVPVTSSEATLNPSGGVVSCTTKVVPTQFTSAGSTTAEGG